MSMLQSRNPAMGVFDRSSDADFGAVGAKRTTMTIGGTLTATGVLLSIVSVVGVLSYQSIASGGFLAGLIWPVMLLGAFGGIVVSFIIYGKPKLAPVIAPVHAVFEGVFVGAASYLIPYYFMRGQDGQVTGAMQTLVLQAVLATLAIAGTMLAGYATGILRVGPVIQKVMVTAAIGLGVYIGVLFLLQMFGIGIWNGFIDSGPIGIGFSLVVVGLASLFLILDFQFIEKGAATGQPKYMEWVGAWGLMVTLVWLYIEVLRLLAKLRSSD